MDRNKKLKSELHQEDIDIKDDSTYEEVPEEELTDDFDENITDEKAIAEETTDEGIPSEDITDENTADETDGSKKDEENAEEPSVKPVRRRRRKRRKAGIYGRKSFSFCRTSVSGSGENIRCSCGMPSEK